MNIVMLIPLIFYVLLISLHVLLAVAVHRNATMREREGESLMFIDPRVWAITALLFGILGLLVYWLMHYSTLAANGKGTCGGHGARMQRALTNNE